MRINRDTLLRIADETVSQRTRRGRSILAAYLSGSLLGDDYLLGGTADIDLTFVHLDQPQVEREIVRLTDDVHLDIAHYEQRHFSQTRRLRLHPWMGPVLYECKVLYDPQHFLDFIQASVRGQFYRADYALKRAHGQLEHARQIWSEFTSQAEEAPGPQHLSGYLRAVDHAANAIAGLSGPPLTERRLLLHFPQRCEAVGRPGLNPALLGMLGGPNASPESLRSWLPVWGETLSALPENDIPPRLHPSRHAYYLRAFEAMLNSEHPHAMLWPLLRTWTQAAGFMPADSAGRAVWEAACARLGLLGDHFSERVEALDAFLDLVEETLENWERSQGG